MDPIFHLKKSLILTEDPLVIKAKSLVRGHFTDPVRAFLREIPHCGTLSTFCSHDYTENRIFSFFPNTFIRWAALFISYTSNTILDYSQKMTLTLYTAGYDFTLWTDCKNQGHWTDRSFIFMQISSGSRIKERNSVSCFHVLFCIAYKAVSAGNTCDQGEDWRPPLLLPGV